MLGQLISTQIVPECNSADDESLTIVAAVQGAAEPLQIWYHRKQQEGQTELSFKILTERTDKPLFRGSLIISHEGNDPATIVISGLLGTDIRRRGARQSW